MFPSQKASLNRSEGELSAVRLLRLPQVLQYFPVSRSAWWAGVKEGRYPEPLRIGPRCVAWRLEDVLALIDSCGSAVPTLATARGRAGGRDRILGGGDEQ
jgi:predicted DNA-binding transcriptional regulator AlpA